MKNLSAQQNCNSMLKISIFLSAAVVLSVIVQLVDSQAANSTTTTTSDGQSHQNDLSHQVNKAKAVPSGRAGRMLDLDRLAGDVSKSSALSVSGNRQSRSGEIEERSKKTSGNKKMKINGFIPIVSMEGATHLAGLTGGGSNSNDDDDNNNSDSGNSDETSEPQQQQSNLREHLATSYGGATSIGHASFPIGNQQQQQTGGEQQWQQVDSSQPQVFSASSLSSLSGGDPNQSAADSARANRKLLGSSNLFSGMTLGQPGKRGLVSSLLPSGLSLGGGGSQAGGSYYPQQVMAHANYKGQPLAGPMNVPAVQSTLLEQGDGCICVPFFQCKNGYLSESQLSKSQLSQLTGQLATTNSFVQVPRSLSQSSNGQTNDLYYNTQMARPQQYTDMTGGAASAMQPTTDAASQQQVMNDIYEQLRKNMESGQLDQQMQPAALLDERAANKVNSSSSAGGQSIEERSLFNGLSNRRNYQTATPRSCGIMRTCCKVSLRMTSGGNQMAATRFINPVGHLHQQLIASPSVGRPQTSQNQYQSQQQQQQLAHRYLQTRPSRMSNAPQLANDFYPPTAAQQHQNHQMANNNQQLDPSAYQLPPTGPSQPMVMESIMQQQQQQPSHQTALVSRPPGASFMSGRCGLRQTLGIAGRVQNAPVAQGLEPGESSADFGEFPAHAAILKRISPGDSLFVCSAVLISSQWLATAAHCVRKHRPEELKVRLGEWDVARDDEFYPFFETSVREIVLNPEFQPTSLANDLALIRLEQPVDGQQMPHVAPACLAQPADEISGGYAGQRCWVAGWGKNAFGQQGTFQSVLKKVDLPVVSHADCELALKYQTKLGKFFRLHQNNICAGGERGKDACEGDGGAGLYCLDPQSQLIKAVGLVSWGVGCGQRGVPGVYVNLANFNNWIEQVVVSSGEENVYALMDGRMSANGSADFKNIISERTNDKEAAVNGTLAVDQHQQQQDQQEGRSMGAAVSTRANETETSTSLASTTTTVMPKTI